jgi:hypothetical protein
MVDFSAAADACVAYTRWTLNNGKIIQDYDGKKKNRRGHKS